MKRNQNAETKPSADFELIGRDSRMLKLTVQTLFVILRA